MCGNVNFSCADQRRTLICCAGLVSLKKTLWTDCSYLKLYQHEVNARYRDGGIFVVLLTCALDFVWIRPEWTVFFLHENGMIWSELDQLWKEWTSPFPSPSLKICLTIYIPFQSSHKSFIFSSHTNIHLTLASLHPSWTDGKNLTNFWMGWIMWIVPGRRNVKK